MVKKRTGTDRSICTWLKNLFGLNVSARSWIPQAERENPRNSSHARKGLQLHSIVIVYKLFRRLCSTFVRGLISDSDAAEMYPGEVLLMSFPVSRWQNMSRLLCGACVCVCVCVCVCRCRLGIDVCTFKLIFVDKYIRISGFLQNKSEEEMCAL